MYVTTTTYYELQLISPIALRGPFAVNTVREREPLPVVPSLGVCWRILRRVDVEQSSVGAELGAAVPRVKRNAFFDEHAASLCRQRTASIRLMNMSGHHNGRPPST
jgi:hypothetical protein